MTSLRRCVVVAIVCFGLSGVRDAEAAPRSFPAGSLIIPMDLAYQDEGLLQAYGLLFQLLRQGVPVSWVIDPAKTWHDAPCDTPADLCGWDCAEEGSGVKCPYPTATPDFFAGAEVVWSDAGAAAGTVIVNHGYRGGPFVIDAPYREAAIDIIDAWNDPSLWPTNSWAQRAVPGVVTVHEATAAFTGDVSRELLAAPTIAVFSDGSEAIATSYLRAAGIKMSNGADFPAAQCGASNCGPGTANPDMLTVPSVMGDMGTCDAPNYDHKNGSLFTEDGLPQYCQIMSMHWDVNDRETVRCDGGNCPATEAECAGETITYHGHEVVAEVRAFLGYPVHFFAECQAVNAYENTVPNPAWPYLDDEARYGHYLTTEGTPPACPCTDPEFECVTGGCGGSDCCLPSDIKELGAGFMIAASPDPYQVLHPEVPYNQLDGAFEPIGGSEPAYNLSEYLGTMYHNDREVTFITGLNGPGEQDVWMTGYLDGECDITDPIGAAPGLRGPAVCSGGKVSYLGGHAFDTGVPVSGSTQTQGARLFLNALYEADCVTAVGQPDFVLDLDPLIVPAEAFPVEYDLGAGYSNAASGAALDAVLSAQWDADATLVDAAGGTVDAGLATWDIGSIAGVPLRPGDPPAGGTRTATVSFPAEGDYSVTLALTYRVGLSTFTVDQAFTVEVLLDSDGDGVPDRDDPFPDDPTRCGDADDDGCDDCDTSCDPGGGDGDGGGCCQTGDGAPRGAAALALLVALGLRRRRR
jgi:MYXO-CTERM domain-containing protein